MRYSAEFTADREVAAALAVKAASSGLTVDSRPVPDGRSRVAVMFEAPDNYDARTLALVVQGDYATEARIRRDSWMFPGPWFDLNEEG